MADLVRLSKFLAFVLRHQANEFGLDLDAEGFADLDFVWGIVQGKFGNRYSMKDLETIVAGDETGKKRYEIRDRRIRAMYGHSSVREIEYEAIEPPEFLYHGTTPQSAESILKTGLQSRGRQYAHLTTNLKIATNVANRRTQNHIILKIHAKEAYQAGYVFHQAETENFLAKEIPPQFIEKLTQSK